MSELVDAPTATLAAGTLFACRDASNSGLKKTTANALAAFIGGGGLSFGGVLLGKTVNQTGNFTGLTNIPWDSEVYDTDAAHTGSSADIVIPAAWNGLRMCFSAFLSLSGYTSTDWCALRISRNNAAAIGLPLMRSYFDGVSGGIQATSAPIVVSTGEIYQAQFNVESDTSITIEADRSFFAAWIVR